MTGGGGRVLVMLFLLVVGVLNEMDWGMNEVWWLVGGGGGVWGWTNEDER